MPSEKLWEATRRASLNAALKHNLIEPSEETIAMFDRAFERLKPYQALFDQAEKRNGLEPGTLMAIAAVESGGDPLAKSPAGAVGLMQFMEPAAKHYGLQIGEGVDERTDPRKSIKAAGKKVKRLIDRSGSYPVALTQYNLGQGNVDRWARGERTLPDETKRYAPKVLAARKRLVPPPAPPSLALPSPPVQEMKPFAVRGDDKKPKKVEEIG